MTANPAIFSLHGEGLKLNTRNDIEPLLKDVDPTKVEEIHLGGNTLGIEAAEALAEFLRKTTILKVADFADIFTGRLISEIPQALTAICDALVDKHTLVEIDLSDNAFGGRVVDPLVPFLTHNRSFQILKLNNNGLGPAGGAVVANALRESARLSKKEGKKSSLKKVICGRNRLEDGSADAWGEAFREHGTLEEIIMQQNGIREDGIAALINGIAANKNLRHLDLQDNTFSRKGSKAASEVLKLWSELEFLNFSDCHLANEGEISPVVEVLSEGSNPKLRLLKLENNNLEVQSFALLAEGIAHLPELKRLEIQWNDAEEDDESIQSLIGTLNQRGGKLIVDDEEEEEEEEKEKEEEEKAKEAAAVAPIEPAAKSTVEKAADALADLMSKVSLGSK